MLKKYKKILQFLFDKYANTSKINKKIDNFEQFSKQNELLSLSEFYKMLKDHDFTDYIT